MSKRPPRDHDWDALKVEWLQGDDTLNEFRIKKDIDRAFFYRMVSAQGWKEEREAIRKKALEKAENKITAELAKRWVRYGKVNDDLLAIAQRIVDDTKDEEGNIQQPIEPIELKHLADTVETTLKSHRLLHGEPTEIHKTETPNIHVQVVQVIKALKAGQVLDVPSEEIDG